MTFALASSASFAALLNLFCFSFILFCFCKLFKAVFALKFSRFFIFFAFLFLFNTACFLRILIIFELTFATVFGANIPPFSNLLIIGFAFALLPYFCLNELASIFLCRLASSNALFFSCFPVIFCFLFVILFIVFCFVIGANIPPFSKLFMIFNATALFA